MGNASSVEPADGDGTEENVVRYDENALEGVGGDDGNGNNNNTAVAYPDNSENPDMFSPGSSTSKQNDNEAMEILFQFIPYYGQGDGSNDSIVRSTLMGLSIEDIDYRDEYGNTLLLLACQYSCEDLVRIMLNKGADPNATNASGACSLHFTCYADSASKPIAKILLQNGANPDVAETSYGCTPLHYCAGTGDIEFCKLLISFGAQPQSIDYYSYTSADYARDAGLPECQSFLNNKIQSASKSMTSLGSDNALLSLNINTTTATSSGSASSANLTSGSSFLTPGRPAEVVIPLEWQVQYDENTKYYNNIKTGEVLWEQELTAKLAADAPKRGLGVGMGTPNASGSQANLSTIQETDPQVLMTSASRECLIAFFTTHDPTRLTEIDSLLTRYKGTEQQMLLDLCKQYKADEGAEIAAFTAKLKELKGAQGGGGGLGGRSGSVASTPVSLSSNFQLGKSTPVANRGTPAGTPVASGVSQAEVLQLQQQMQQRLSVAEAQFDEERTQYRTTIADKEGAIAKLESSLEAVTKEKQNIQVYAVLTLYI